MRLFALILLSAGFASPASGNGAGDGAPTIVGTKTHQLALPASWSKALARKYPDLKMLSDGSIQDATRSSYSYSATEAPFAVVLDLNGDGRKDVALLAAEKGRTALLAMFAASRGVQIREIASYGPTNETYGTDLSLRRAHAGAVNAVDGSFLRELGVPAGRQGVEVAVIEKGSIAYFWNDSAFVDIVTAD